jgi:hypothetical protein
MNRPLIMRGTPEMIAEARDLHRKLKEHLDGRQGNIIMAVLENLVVDVFRLAKPEHHADLVDLHCEYIRAKVLHDDDTAC